MPGRPRCDIVSAAKACQEEHLAGSDALFFPDRIGAYRQARRVLRPGGYFLFNVWDDLNENEIACAVTEGLASIFSDDPPDFLARVPYGYHDAQKICEDLRAAGFMNTK